MKECRSLAHSVGDRLHQLVVSAAPKALEPGWLDETPETLAAGDRG